MYGMLQVKNKTQHVDQFISLSGGLGGNLGPRPRPHRSASRSIDGLMAQSLVRTPFTMPTTTFLFSWYSYGVGDGSSAGH
jgi:hypothetical protein